MRASALSAIPTHNRSLLTRTWGVCHRHCCKITNIEQLTAELLEQNQHFAELSSGQTNQTELVALLLIQGKTFAEGIENVFRHIEGSCSMLLLTEEGIIAVRDDWGRTPVIIGKKTGPTP